MVFSSQKHDDAPAAKPLEQAEATQLAEKLQASGKQPAKALAALVRQGYKPHRQLLPPGAKVNILTNTFAVSQQYGPNVQAEVSGLGRFRLYLAYEDGEWLIKHTEEMR
jgi:hypothetical protein